jgi:hypothetical protein
MRRVLLPLFASGLLSVIHAQLAGPSFSHSEVIPSFLRVDPALASFETLFDAPVDNNLTLLIVRARMAEPTAQTQPTAQAQYDNWLRNDYIGLFFESSGEASRLSTLTIFRNDATGTTVKVQRATKDSVVLTRADSSYGIGEGSLKLFLDPVQKKHVKTVKFDPVAVDHLIPSANAVYAVARGLRLVVKLESDRAAFATTAEAARAIAQAEALADADPMRDLQHEAPESTVEELNRWRGDEIREHRTGGEIHEQVGPTQVVGGRVWFGKTFYDGEGSTGVGAIGYYDRLAKAFTLFRPPELVRWSVSAILVEENVVWAGLMRRPEGASFSGGLMRYDLSANRADVFPVEHVIRTIARGAGGLRLGSTEGVYTVRNGNLTHLVLEPMLDGTFGLVPMDPASR